SDKNEYRFLSEKLNIEVCNSYIKPSLRKKTEVNLEHFEKLVSGFRPDIIHSHLFTAEFLTRYRISPGVKYFTHCHDNIPQFKKWNLKEGINKKAATDYTERSFLFSQYKKCDNHFIAISRAVESYLKKNLPGTLARKIHYLRNAIDLGRFASPARSELTGSDIVLINVGSFFP